MESDVPRIYPSLANKNRVPSWGQSGALVKLNLWVPEGDTKAGFPILLQVQKPRNHLPPWPIPFHLHLLKVYPRLLNQRRNPQVIANLSRASSNNCNLFQSFSFTRSNTDFFSVEPKWNCQDVHSVLFCFPWSYLWQPSFTPTPFSLEIVAWIPSEFFLIVSKHSFILFIEIFFGSFELYISTYISSVACTTRAPSTRKLFDSFFLLWLGLAAAGRQQHANG